MSWQSIQKNAKNPLRGKNLNLGVTSTLCAPLPIPHQSWLVQVPAGKDSEGSSVKESLIKGLLTEVREVQGISKALEATPGSCYHPLSWRSGRRGLLYQNPERVVGMEERPPNWKYGRPQRREFPDLFLPLPTNLSVMPPTSRTQSKARQHRILDDTVHRVSHPPGHRAGQRKVENASVAQMENNQWNYQVLPLDFLNLQKKKTFPLLWLLAATACVHLFIFPLVCYNGLSSPRLQSRTS